MFPRKAQKKPRTCKRLSGRFRSVKKFPGHSRPLFFAEFLETRIVPQRIEHRIEPEQRGRKRDAHTTKTAAWYREKFLSRRDSAVRLSCLCYHADEELERSRTVERIFLKRARGRGFLGESQCSGLVTESNIGKGHITDELVIIRLFFEKRFQFV